MAEKIVSFVDAIVKDPANPPQVKVLVGYVGKSATAGHTRIYLDHELSEHVDVPNGAVVHTQDVPNDPLGAKYVWVQRDAEVTRRDSNKTEVKARFLAGPMTAGAQGGAEAALAARPSVNIACPTPSFNPNLCPSNLGACPSVDIPCVTRNPGGCPPITVNPANCPGNTLLHCPSQLVRCPTVLTALCPVTVHNCPILTRPIVCQQPSQLLICASRTLSCPSHGFCPSAVDACPSALICDTGTVFNPLM